MRDALLCALHAKIHCIYFFCDHSKTTLWQLDEGGVLGQTTALDLDDCLTLPHHPITTIPQQQQQQSSHLQTSASTLSSDVGIITTSDIVQGNGTVLSWSGQIQPLSDQQLVIPNSTTRSMGKMLSLSQMLPIPDINQFHLNAIWLVV